MEGLSKSERIVSQKLIDELFSKQGSHSLVAFPIRAVYRLSPPPTCSLSHLPQILISVPKRNFHHAVDRNRVKRQIREFYRTSSVELKEIVARHNKGLVLAFLYNDNRLWDSDKLAPRLRAAFEKLQETLSE